MKHDNEDSPRESAKAADPQRRRFMKAAGGAVLAVPAMETLSRQGILLRAAKAQTVNGGIMDGIGGSTDNNIV
jgi:hypothetical protein